MNLKDKRMMHNYLSEEIEKIIPQIEEELAKAENKILEKSDIIAKNTKLDLLKISKTLDPEWNFVSRWGSDKIKS